MSSAVVTIFRQSFARRSRREAPRVARATRRVASSTSFQASFSHSSDDWCTVWKSSSSRWTHSSAVFCSASSSSVRR